MTDQVTPPAVIEAINPHDWVKKEDVQKTLSVDQGPQAILKSFEVIDFTTKGDNYACLVSSVVVEYDKSGEMCAISYIVKLNPGKEGIMAQLMDYIFDTETVFLKTLLPCLNDELSKTAEPCLKIPKYFHSVSTKGQQVIYLEDLRCQGFKMHSRQETLDKRHADLIIKELARFHASSSLYLATMDFSDDKFNKMYPSLKTNYESMMRILTENGMKMVEQGAAGIAGLVEQVPGYEYIGKFIRSKLPTAEEDLMNMIMNYKQPFVTLRHGDCWNNNFLFKYAEDGAPIDCRILDFQGVQLGSPAVDLNHFLYPCLTSKLRQAELTNLLNAYYANFASVFAQTSVPMRFTLDQFNVEFRSKLYFGFMISTMLVPAMLLDPEDCPKLEEFLCIGEGMENAYLEFQKKTHQVTLASPHLRPRLLDMFDEIKEFGFFDEDTPSKE